MNEIAKAFNIGFLLRSLFAGVFFVVAYHISSGGENQTDSLFALKTENLVELGLPFALTAGVAVYSLHRSVIYPFFENWFDAKELDKWEGIKRVQQSEIFISESVAKRLVRRWDRKAIKGEHHLERAKQLQVWADYIHLQYAIGWCIVCGSMVGVIARNDFKFSTFNPWEYEINPKLAIPAVLFLSAALYSNVRSLIVEYYTETEKPPPDTTEFPSLAQKNDVLPATVKS